MIENFGNKNKQEQLSEELGIIRQEEKMLQKEILQKTPLWNCFSSKDGSLSITKTMAVQFNALKKPIER